MTNNVEILVESTACDSFSLDCMYGLCDTCKGTDVTISQEYDENVNVWWWQWVTKKESFQKKTGDQVYTSQITVKGVLP